MSVNFNYIEKLSENTFLFKHLKQPYLYLVIEYKTKSPAFFKEASQTLNIQNTVTLKMIRNYANPSSFLENQAAMPWGAYVATLPQQDNIYHFVYEVEDPQTQRIENTLLENLFQHQKIEFFQNSVFTDPIKNVLTTKERLGTYQDYRLKNKDPKIKVNVQQNEGFVLDLTPMCTEYILFKDHFECTPLLKERNPIRARFTDPMQAISIRDIHLNQVFQIRSPVTSLLAKHLQIIDAKENVLKTYEILIRNGRSQESNWDQNTPHPFTTQIPIEFKNLSQIIKLNFLTHYHADYDHFWGERKNHTKDELPLNLYWAKTFQKTGWVESCFQSYIYRTHGMISKNYYLYEKDPMYSEWFHLYLTGKLEHPLLLDTIKTQKNLIQAKPKTLWSLEDAALCLNTIYVYEKEKTEPFQKEALECIDFLCERLKASPKATVFYPKHSQFQMEPVYGIGPQGLAVLALWKGFKVFGNTSYEIAARKQMEFLLKTYPIEKQVFAPHPHDPHALVYTAQALKILSQHDESFSASFQEAKNRILTCFQTELPHLDLAIQADLLELALNGFYFYFE